METTIEVCFALIFFFIFHPAPIRTLRSCGVALVFGIPETVFPGVYGEVDTPVPIPNTDVKGLSGDGTTFKSVGE